jgi:muramoyltetrapeptide carboxypeptidase
LNGRPIAKPERLRAGDLVGVVAPSGVVDEERLAGGVRALEALGWRVTLGSAVLARRAYLAGSDDERRHDLQRMIDDPAVRAVFCARGGYGSQRIVPALDLAPLARRPKPLVGYSDATALLLAAVRAGVVAVHGPMVAVELAGGLSDHALAHLRSVLTDPDYVWQAPVPLEIRRGRATGRLVGGCLSVLASTVGTPWAVDTEGAILFLEDVHEWPYRLDRLLTQVGQSGLLDRVAGVVFGTMATCRSHAGVTALDVVRDFFATAPYPVGFGLDAGHTDAATGIENLALPLGVRVTLDTAAGTLTAAEPAVA